MTPTSFSTSAVSTITMASQGQPSRKEPSGPLLVHLLQPIQRIGSPWMRPKGGWSSSGTQNIQSSTGQYSTHAGEPAQPVQHSVITASSFGFFLRGVVIPLERGSCFNASGTIPATRVVSYSVSIGRIIPSLPVICNSSEAFSDFYRRSFFATLVCRGHTAPLSAQSDLRNRELRPCGACFELLQPSRGTMTQQCLRTIAGGAQVAVVPTVAMTPCLAGYPVGYGGAPLPVESTLAKMPSLALWSQATRFPNAHAPQRTLANGNTAGQQVHLASNRVSL